ncbi:MAG: FAD-dependent oxidoreductase, partial [Oscillospiraceae bacterium]
AKGLCDFVFMGHGLIVEPHLVNLIEQNRYSEARPCIGCSICTDDQLSYERSIHCTGNPVAGNGANDYTIPPATNIKNVLVVGGGVGGVEAARIAAIRGHKVTLVEKTDKLGGQLTYVVIPPNKQNVVPMFDYLNKQVEVHNVEVLYNTEATEEFILAQNPDVVIWAAGVIPHIIPIKGYEKPSVCSAKQALDGMPLGETVVIIGGVVGCETAELLASQGKKVHIVEMLDEIAGKMAATNRSILLGRLKGYGVQIHLSCACKEITDKGIIMEDKDGTVSEIQCDNVIISVGDKPNNELYKRISKKVKEAYCIGDSNEPGSIAIAVSQGYYTALKI